MAFQKLTLLGQLVVVLGSTPAFADICDYRLSKLVGSIGSGATVAATSTVGMSKLGMDAAGLYLIQNYTTGAMMIGSTSVGASGAGTAGIISGTSGGLGAAAAFVTAPATLIAAGSATLAVLGLEGACYFSDERITNKDDVPNVLRALVQSGDPANIGFVEMEDSGTWFWVRNAENEIEAFAVSNLYIVNAQLYHRDFFVNTKLGDIAAVLQRDATD